jgi:hypothetical protein
VAVVERRRRGKMKETCSSSCSGGEALSRRDAAELNGAAFAFAAMGVGEVELPACRAPSIVDR